MVAAVSEVSSAPSVTMLLKLSPMFSLIDEYTFYVYHRAKYDRGFTFIAQMCWNVTNSKWVPSFLEELTGFMDTLDGLVKNTTSTDAQTVAFPNKFVDFGEANNFYENLAPFFLISLPMNIATFLVLMLIVYTLRKYKICLRLCSMLSQFRCFVCFWSSVFVDNMTYLSFKCFLQFDRFVPYSHGNSSLLSACCCITMLFLLIFTVCAIGSVGRVFSKVFEVENFRQSSLKGYLFISLMTAARFAAGFCHAYLNDPFDRSLALLVIHMVAFGGMLLCWRGMQYKFYRLVYFGICAFKVGLHFKLFL